MKKKRLLVFAALILTFAIACAVQIAPQLRVFAVNYEAAQIGTATLADEGDTVFIRMAKFTIGGEEITAPGFTVANAAAGEDPADGVPLDVLTPITHENTLTGTLDKDIYVCRGVDIDGGRNATDLYLGDLKLTAGHKLYTDRNSDLNFLGGSFEADAIVTKNCIYVGSADVTVNSDLTGFHELNLFASTEAFGGGAAKTPASVTVNGNLTSNGGNLVGVNAGSSLTVTGDVDLSIPYFSVNAPYWGDVRSCLTVGGSFTLSGPAFSLVHSDAEIGGALKTDNRQISLNYGAYLKAGSVEGSFMNANHDSSFEIDGDVKLSGTLDMSATTKNTAPSYSIGGDLKCGVLCLNGKDFSLSVGGSVDCSGVFVQKGVLDIDGDLSVSTSGFTIENSTVDVAGDVTGKGLYLQYSDAKFHSSFTDSAFGSSVCVYHSTLTIDGDASLYAPTIQYGSSVTVGGSLNHVHSENDYWSYITVTYNSALKVGGDVDGAGRPLCASSSTVDIGGDLKNTSTLTVTNGNGSYRFYNGSSYETITYQASDVKIGGGATLDSWFSLYKNNLENTLDVGKDFVYNNQNGAVEGTMTVGGDFVNNAQNNNGLYVSGKLAVGGDVKMNTLLLGYRDYAQNLDVGGDITARRITDVKKTVEGTYVIGDVQNDYTPLGGTINLTTSPFFAQTVALTIDGEPYALDVRDLTTKVYEPIRVSGEYAVVYETDGVGFIENTVAEERYFPEIGLDLPGIERLAKRIGYIPAGWYDNAGFEGDPITEIPVGETGAKTVYMKWDECDHAASEAQPTCTESAVCTVCELELPALGHSFTKYVPNGDRTCTEDGTKTAKCDRCDETDTLADPALGHKFGKYVPNGDRTCTEDGTMTAHCKFCDATDTVADKATGHKFTEWENVEGVHRRVCKVCGETEEKKHVIDRPNAQGEGFCSVCGEYRCLFCDMDEKLEPYDDSSSMFLIFRMIHMLWHILSNIKYAFGA
ncbi:MAG: hypothetical protein IJK23_14475 [Clostridia bacterium]|nr:hypothetical protein [Clostridia bacterium]